jgi:hypothetical protein
VNLTDAIALFEKDRKGQFSAEDVSSIVAVANDLSLSAFDLKQSPSKKYPEYIYDSQDTIHIHRTMIVGRQDFVGTREEPSKYLPYPFQRDLENWVSTTGQYGRPLCPGCNIELPIVLRCDYCDFDHNVESA